MSDQLLDATSRGSLSLPWNFIQICDLSPGTLYRYVIYPLVRAEADHPSRQSPPSSLEVIGIIRAAHCWNGLHKSASSLVQALEHLTCVQGLHLLTWLPWEAVLSSQLLLRRRRAWCPHCLSERRSKGQTIYEPLLWTLQVIKNCPIHDCALAEVCPCCHRSLSVLSSNVRAGHCTQCQQWLGYSGEDQWSSEYLRESSQLQEQRWIVENIGKLVARASGVSNSLSPKWIDESLEDMISRLIKGNDPAFAELTGVRHKIVSFWQGGRNIPRLEFILKLCYRLNFSAADFLTAMLGRQNCGTQIDEIQLQSHKIPARREAIAAWEANIRRTLEAALQEEPPPPLSEIADRLGYATTAPLYSRFGEMSQRIVARYHTAIGGRSPIQPPPDEKQTSQLRRLLEQELSKENPDYPRNLAKGAGYKYVDSAKSQCPELWQTLLDKRRKYREDGKQNEREREVITSAFSEDPTPTMKEIARRLGYRSNPNLSQRFPNECRAIREKHARRRKEQLEELEAKLRAALSEETPRPLTQVAVNIHYNRHDCYLRWPEVCRAIAARHIDYVKECARKRRLDLKEQVRQIVLELHQSGLHPTKERVIPLLHNPPMTCFVALNEILRELKEELNLPTL